MSIIMTILSFAFIGQVSTEQAQAQAALEPAQQTAVAEDTQPGSRIFSEDGKESSAEVAPTQQTEIPTAANASVSADARVESVQAADQKADSRIHPPELIAEALTLPTESRIAGQPLTLMQALATSPDRRQQLSIARAYWQTAETVAKYHYCFDHVEQLGRLECRKGDEASLAAERAAATAMLRETELAAGSAQYELAALVQLPADSAPPLPADRPHVGAYRTNYQELFGTRPAPDRARLIDRTLPVRRTGIDQRAIAVQAAQDAFTAATEAYGSGHGSLGSLILSSGQLLHQQWIFMETVCRYNQDIAEYAMIVAAPNATPQVLVGFMIISPQNTGQSLIPESQGGVRQAGLNEPVPNQPGWNGSGQSTFAPRNVPGASAIPTVVPGAQWGSTVSPIRGEPTLAPQGPTATPNGQKEPTPAPPRVLSPVGAKNESTLAQPREEPRTTDGQKGASDAQGVSDRPGAENRSKANSGASQEDGTRRVPATTGDPFSRRVETANKPPLDAAADSDSWSSRTASGGATAAKAPASADAGISLYRGLVESAPAERAKQLAATLHWDRSLPEGAGRSTTLEECLARQTSAGQGGIVARKDTSGVSSDRRAMVDAFWIARQRAAEYQAVAQETEFLENLVPLVLERRGDACGGAAMLYLRAARQNAKANIFEAQLALFEAQFELALRTRTAAETLWPLPSTPPHAGQYAMHLEAQPRTLVQSWPMRRLATAIPAYSTSLEEHAAAVVSADTARTKSIQKYVTGKAPIEQILEETARQTTQTFDFLQTLTDYNRSIAQYALAVLPADAQPTRVAAALVVRE
jgi:hypothetical protein